MTQQKTPGQMDQSDKPADYEKTQTPGSQTDKPESEQGKQIDTESDAASEA